jgi:predicted nucleotidyltransferase
MTPEAAPLPELLQAKLQPLRELCERYGVEKLELYGSAARGEFDPAHSDLDFIVQMKGRREPGLCTSLLRLRRCPGGSLWTARGPADRADD